MCSQVYYVYITLCKNNLINFNFNIGITGDVTKGELGFAAIPGEEENFKNSIEKTIEYAKALDCKMLVYLLQTRSRINFYNIFIHPCYIFIIRNYIFNRIHVMSGKVETPTTANDVTYEKNLLYAIEKCQKEDIIVVIEPINNYSVQNYYMNNFQKGTKLNLYHLII